MVEKAYTFLFFSKKKYKNVITIHIQNPKIKFNKFDFIIAPEHDGIKGSNVISSIGALHKYNKRIIKNISDKNFKIPKTNLVSVIIGGSNNHYKFRIEEIKDLIEKIKIIKNSKSDYHFLIIHSRRTDKKLIKALYNNLKDIAILWNENDINPYGFALKNSSFFIVSSDSTSMISECASTGRPVYVFHLPFKRNSKRFEEFHNKFEKMNITKKFDSNCDLLPWSYNSLNESERIASIVKKRILKVY